MTQPLRAVLISTDDGMALTLAPGDNPRYPIPLSLLEDQVLFHRSVHKLEAGDLSFVDDWKQLA